MELVQLSIISRLKPNNKKRGSVYFTGPLDFYGKDADNMNTNELYHHGVKGQKWGVRKGLQDYKNYRERRKIDKKVNDPWSFGVHQNEVLSKRNEFYNSNKEVNAKWKAAFKAGEGSKEWKEYENAQTKYIHKLNEQFKKQYVDGFIKDVNMRRLSEQGRIYLEERIEQIWPTK